MWGCAMGSPVSPVIANLYMEHFEITALRNSPVKPSVWLRYVDDTYVIIRETDVKIFTEHINSQNSHIKFTSEPEVDGFLAFLDTKVLRNADGSVSISIYRKPTHTDQYLHFDSHHPIAHKLSVIRTLFHRAEIAVTDPEERVKEVEHIKSALGRCGYHNWTFGLAKAKDKSKNTPDPPTNANQVEGKKSSTYITLPFIEGLSQKLQRIFKSYGVATSFRPHSTLRKLLVAPKDPTPTEKKSGVVYEIPCGECTSSYIGQTGRQLGDRLKEHKSTAPSRKRSAVAEHKTESHHNIDWESTKVI
ncbi:uncharacterized protein [Amphiura filiformis]|uniref:uncharacterized protein n=1 Tax=Amphiura filiformis TaxID=82378 RepID=UPI003B212FE5